MEKYRFERFHLIFGAAFCALAALLLYAGIANVFKWNNFRETAVPVNAVITEIHEKVGRSGGKHRKRTYDVDIAYEYDGREYSGEINYYIQGMEPGDILTIYVDPANPEYTMSEPWNGLVMSIIMAIVTGGVGTAFFVYEIRMKKYINGLIEADKHVFAVCTQEKPSGTKVNGVSYNCAEFIFTDGSGKKTYFYSRPYPPDEQPYSVGESVKVYVDIENKPRRYYVQC